VKKYFKIISICLVSIISFTSCSGNNEDAETEALKKNLIPITTVEAGSGLDDLMPLKEILKDKKIIAIGEATHGTSEFFKMKHRFFEFLVEEMGYRIFTMEVDGGSGQVINDYILNGKGTATKALKATKFFTSNNMEVKEMLEWTKDYNNNPSHKEKIKFYGFDMQFISDTLPKLSFYLGKIDKDLEKEAEQLLYPLYNSNIMNLTSEEKSDLQNKAEKLKVKLEENKNKFSSDKLKNDYEMALWNFNLVIQYINYNSLGGSTPSLFAKQSNLRDKYMAENVKWILDHEHETGYDKIMLWAHNWHVSYYSEGFTYMGSLLKNIYKYKYYSIGFDFSKGSFYAQDLNSLIMKIFTINNNDPRYLCYVFDKTDIPILFLDFKSSSKNKLLDDLLSKEQYIHMIGARYDDKNEQFTSPLYPPNKLFDGLIYIKETTASTIY